MAKYITAFETINDYNVSKEGEGLNYPNISLIKSDNHIEWAMEAPTPPTPSRNCYEVIQTPIASYTSTTDSVYSFADLKWYMKNNLNQYEEYGIYETGTSLSDFTYYPNKLVIISETEYQYQSNGWVEVGEYIDSQTTYEVTDDSMTLQGKTLSTTFKIPYADVENIGGNLDLRINTEDGGNLHITTDNYEYDGGDSYEGTVTNDGEYYYYSLPSEAPSSVDIQNTEYMNPDSIHLIFSQNIYKVTDDSMALQGKTLSTTFKIPYADIETIGGNLDFNIMTEDGDRLHITTDSYNYEGEETYEGTVTNDGEYYYYSLPSEAPSSIVIQETGYMNPDPIHLISSSRQISVEYAEKEMPLAKVYNTVAEMEAITCPDVGISQYGVVGNNLYQFEESEGWVNKAKNSLKFVAKYNNGYANVIECNASNELTTGDTEPSYLSRDAMTEAYIGDCVTSIGDNALSETWAKSNSLTSVTIGDGVTSIGGSAFYSCKALESVTIGNSVTSIGQSAFRLCSGLTSINIPNSVTSIGGYAFDSCTSLTSVNIPNGVTIISEHTFRGCSGLTSVTIGNSVTSIGQGAFTSCRGLTSVTIPSSVTSISNWAFSSCKALTSVTVNATTPPTLGAYAFDGTTNISQIYVPSESVDAYKSATNWSSYASRIQAIS